MNINFGLFPSLQGKARGRERRRLLVERALNEMKMWKGEIEI
jgi:folate-dependent tRNA-U54 methylase TrmFO/GidA